MAARVTMRDVAKAAGVSPMTVSRAFRDDATVSPATRTLVRETAARLGYVYDTTAQAFRAQRSGFVAVTLPSINNANFASTHRALTREMAATGLQILLGVTNYRLEEEERLIRQLLERRPEAVILTGGAHTEAVQDLLGVIDVPVVEIWDRPADPLGHVVGFSNRAAMELIVEHLAGQGRRRLGFLGASAETDRRGAERRQGAVEAARRLGLPPIVEIDAGPAPVSMTDGARAVAEAGDRLRGLDALVCVSDPTAFGAIMALEAAAVSVPNDIAVTGFGNFEIARICRPTITTVDVGAEDIGREVGRLVADLLEDNATDHPAADIRITPRLLAGASG